LLRLQTRGIIQGKAAMKAADYAVSGARGRGNSLLLGGAQSGEKNCVGHAVA